MDPRKEQILHWIRTGEHVIQTKPTAALTSECTALPSDCGGTSAPSSNTSSSITDKLVGVDDDPLIPTAADIACVFNKGRATWTHFVRLAESSPPEVFPAELGDPSIMLKDVPALPDTLPQRGFFIGRPLWHVPDPEKDEAARKQELNLQYALGARKYFHVSCPKPIECRVSARPSPPGHAPWAPQRGLSLLTMCWSYILSVRLLELQGRKVVYTRHSLLPIKAKIPRAKPGVVVLNLGAYASHRLMRWLCAILSPEPGWSADGGDFPPWAAFCSGDARFVVASANDPAAFSNEPPPDSTQATELLIELCVLYGLFRPRTRPGEKLADIPPSTAAFLAALALPFYRNVDLTPQFPLPSLRRRSTNSAVLEPTVSNLRQYVADLRYYMTLSMHPRSIGSVIWSIFWQPDIESNLVSPWLSSTLSVIKPILESRDLRKLAKVFAFRRPRVASWWLGILLLGDSTILDRIARYLETLEERWGFGSMAPPDPTVTAWTGSPQSFLDDDSTYIYIDQKEPVPRADLLRHRFNFRLQDEAYRKLSWRPFGHVTKELIEPDLWPWLERGHSREYIHWVWWVRRGKHVVHDVQRGFRRDTGRFAAKVPDRLQTIPAAGHAEHDALIKLGPSKEATLLMISYCMEDVCGDRDIYISALPEVRSHPWLKDWRDLE